MKKNLIIAAFLMLLVACKPSPEEQKRRDIQETNWKSCKEHMLPSDKIVRSEAGGTYIIENSNRYYRIHPDGQRDEVKRVYHSR